MEREIGVTIWVGRGWIRFWLCGVEVPKRWWEMLCKQLDWRAWTSARNLKWRSGTGSYFCVEDRWFQFSKTLWKEWRLWAEKRAKCMGMGRNAGVLKGASGGMGREEGRGPGDSPRPLWSVCVVTRGHPTLSTSTAQLTLFSFSVLPLKLKSTHLPSQSCSHPGVLRSPSLRGNIQVLVSPCLVSMSWPLP